MMDHGDCFRKLGRQGRLVRFPDPHAASQNNNDKGWENEMSNDGSKLDLKRRGFLSGGLITFGAAGLASLGLPTPSKAAELPVLSDAIDPVDTMDPPAPPNMKKGAQLDARFPVSYRRSVPQACRVMAAHFDAIATRDYKALARPMQFPFALEIGR